MQQSFTGNQQSLFMMAVAIFVSVTAAVIVSTLVIMSFVRGEIASAITAPVHTAAPATAQTVSCAVPAGEAAAAASSAGDATVSTGGGQAMAAPLTQGVHFAKFTPVASVTHSFNNTSTTTMNTTNNITNTEVTTTVTDSFNDNSVLSHNPIIVRDNTVNVNSNNNSDNTATTNTTNNVTTTTTNTTTNTNSNNTTNNVASNNTTNTNSNNTFESHVLSDNTTVVVLP